MKKSNKGFTLIELLASVVILGILLVFAGPRIFGMISLNRDKMYVTDAKKLMAQAEYKIKASSSTLEKPSPGNCIVISLVYLETSDFDVAPNRGQYIKEASYVVAKNVDGKLEYSAAIVEKLKDGSYKGIELTKGSLLLGDNATKFVTGIKKDDLVKVEDNLMVDYINEHLGEDYVTKIEHTYNEPDLADHSSKGGLEPPVITKATLTSTSGKDYNSLDATLTLNVDDKDTPKNKIKVYLSTQGYEDDEAHEYDYGDQDSYIKDDFHFDQMVDSRGINFSYDNNPIVNLYIIVKDDDQNEDRTTIVYNLHTNTAPVIDKKESGFSKQVTDKVNRVNAIFRLSVSDDIDDTDNLKVCFTENLDATSCNGTYKNYSELFTDGEMTYKFSDDKCALNGVTRTVRVYVRDGKGLESYADFPYAIHNNTQPRIDDITIESIKEPFMTGDTATGSLKIKVKVSGSDDVSYNSNMKVEISEANTEKATYTFDPSSEMDYELNGEYDGSTKNIKIALIDECGLKREETKSYKVYSNQAPEVKNIEIVSNGFACNNEADCPINEGGNSSASVYFELYDDLDYNSLDSDLVCVSEKKSDCLIDSNFKEYSTYEGGFAYTFNSNSDTPYDGQEKTLYIIAKDSQGITNYNDDTKNSVKYKLYGNKYPEVSNFEVKSKGKAYTATGSLDALLYFDVIDDLDSTGNLKYTVGIKNGNNVVLSEDTLTPQPIDADALASGIPYHIAGKHDGTVKTVVLTVYDSYSETTGTSETYEYELYKNLPPQIFTAGIPNSSEEDELIEYDDDSEDKNNNNIKDTDETFTVKYVNGEHGDFIEDETNKTIFTGLRLDDMTPEYNGDVTRYEKKTDPTEPNPNAGDGEENNNGESSDEEVIVKPKAKEHWVFTKWKPYVTDTIRAETASTSSVITYVAQFKEDLDDNGIPDDEDVQLDTFNIVPLTGKCHKNFICPYLKSGNPNVEVVFDIEDDIDSTETELNDILVCVTDDANKCTNKKVCDPMEDGDSVEEYVDSCFGDGKFVRYSKFLEAGRKFEFNRGKVGNDLYDGAEHTIYVRAMDSEEEVSTVEKKYTIYENQAPTIINDSVSVSSTVAPEEKPAEEEGGEPTITYYNSKDIIFTVDAIDDYDLPINLQVAICSKLVPNGQEKCEDYVEYNYDHKYDATLQGANYNVTTAQKFKVYAKVKDSLGSVSKTAELDYTLYKDTTPVIESVVATYTGAQQYVEPDYEETENPDPEPSGGKKYRVVYKARQSSWGGSNQYFSDVTFNNLSEGDPTPIFDGTMRDYGDNITLPKGPENVVFIGWSPSLQEFIRDEDSGPPNNTIVYTARWGRDADHDGVPDDGQEMPSLEPEGVTKGVWEGGDHKLIVSVKVKDPFDSYKICITQVNNSNACNGTFVGKDSNGTRFSAEDLHSGIVYYVKENAEDLQYYEKDGLTATEYYAFVQDSYGHISNGYSFYGAPYTQCTAVEAEESKGVYDLKEGNAVSADACGASAGGGMCYYANDDDVQYIENEIATANAANAALQETYGDEPVPEEELVEVPLNSDRLVNTSSIVAKYTRILSYADRIHQNHLCEVEDREAQNAETPEVEPPLKEFEHNCSFIDCFRHPKYNESSEEFTHPYMMAVGMRKRTIPGTEPIEMTTESGHYEGQDYYQLYEVSYDGHSGVATLTPTSTKILVDYYNETTTYKYNRNNPITYVRVRD
ncbi:MAG: type II secretion system protein [Bacilli bacterium]|nr:type II secretion system protein [Bacilli bacterium]